MIDTSLLNIQKWMQTTLTTEGGLYEKLVKASYENKISIDQIIKDDYGIDPVKRINIYTSGYMIRLVNCLKSHFPLTLNFMGENLFVNFAKAYILTIPSSSWNLSELGKGFSDFLNRTKPDLKNIDIDPFLILFPIELTKFEHAKGLAGTLKGCEEETTHHFSIPSFLGNLNLNDLNYSCPECLQLLQLKYKAHTYVEDEPFNDNKLRNTYIALSRKNYRITCLELEEWQFQFLQTLQKTNNFQTCLNNLNNNQKVIMTNWVEVLKNRGIIY